MKPIYQCCYTNATQMTGDTETSGWREVSVSPNIPDEARSVCVKLQNANAVICADAVNEQGKVLVLYEIQGDGNYLYVIRTQFGLRDRLGRPNLFSHAIIFHLQDNRDVLWNPNFYLALNRSAFKSAENEPSWQGEPAYQQLISLETAMQWAGIDRKKYTVLIQCVYAQMSGPKDADPLYIQYNGTRQLQGTLYCICAGIPHFMLKTLRIATCPTANDRQKDFVFSQSAHKREKYLIPQTGENSRILTQRLVRKIERYGFIDYAVRKLPLKNFAAFFDNLDRAAAILGDPSASNVQILKLAFQFGWEHTDEATLTPMELERNFSDALRLPLSGNEFAEKLLARMLKQIIEQNIHLAADSKVLLSGWLSSAKTEDFKRAGREYKNREKTSI